MKHGNYYLLAGALLLPPMAANGQTTHSERFRPNNEADVAVMYSEQRGTQTNGNGFLSQGGTVQFTFGLVNGLSAVVDVNAEANGNVNGSGVNVATVTTNFGPQYRFRIAPRAAILAEGLAGVVHGVSGLYPKGATVNDTAIGLSVQAGGAFEIRRRLFAIRPVQVDYVRTQLPNGTTNVQNNMRFSAGIVFRLSR